VIDQLLGMITEAIRSNCAFAPMITAIYSSWSRLPSETKTNDYLALGGMVQCGNEHISIVMLCAGDLPVVHVVHVDNDV
jgi:hypothetical protein